MAIQKCVDGRKVEIGGEEKSPVIAVFFGQGYMGQMFSTFINF